MVSEKTPENIICVNAAEHDDHIESVTVFQANRAEIKRRIKLDLKQGQNCISIDKLPSCVYENSIRVESASNPPSSTEGLLGEALEEQRHALELLHSERMVAKQQSSYLELYGKALDKKPIEEVERFLDIFAPRQLAVAKRLQELDTEITRTEKLYNDAYAKAHTTPQDEIRRTKVTITVLADIKGQAEILLTYAVSKASWTPSYDIRTSIAKTPDTPSRATLHYRASVTQTTGENWPDVALTLSTASPQLGSNVPSLKAWRVGFISPLSPPPQPQAPMPWGGPSSPFFSPTSPGYTPASPRYSPVSPRYSPYASSRPVMAHRSARVEGGGVLSASFGISGQSNIPSEDDSHKVVITVLELDAELEWVCIPREQENVFLRCKIMNSSLFTLLPGETSVFLDDNFVSKSTIEHVSPNESFRASLGIDSALRVSYPPARTLNRTVNKSGFFMGNNPAESVAACSQRINIRNTRSTTVTSLHIFDHVPVSTDADLKINILSPNSLGPIDRPAESGNEALNDGKKKDRPWTDVKSGIKARWAPLDIGGEGTVEWECEIKPNEEIELDLSWEIQAPVGKSWENK
ncbi:mucoidy inhibitor A [Ceratobasidium sp. AG-Ba]|nr:mucoidy inhibitor A [Ceratobasidium sp. AG-Ba]